MTFAVLEDILQKFPELIQDGKLVIRSGNCSTQYKSRYVFAMMKAVAMKYQVHVIWFYGEPGHDRGLIDAMSSFGCKAPLRQGILNDMWFHNACEMVDFLNREFQDDISKFYSLVDDKQNAVARKLPRAEHPIDGCRKMHMISVDQYGDWVTKTVLGENDNQLFSLELNNYYEEDYYSEIDEHIAENNDVCNTLQLKFDFIEPGTYVASRTPISCESFYLFKITSKHLADDYLTDPHGHTIAKGESYFVGCIFEKTANEMKKHSLQTIKRIYKCFCAP